VNGTGQPTVAVVGGTGALGGALTRRFARAGLPVVIGSRDAHRAVAAAAAVAEELGPEVPPRGTDNAAAAAAGDVVFVTVPFASQEATLAAIRDAARNKLVVDATVPLAPPKVMTFRAPADGSAAGAARRILGDEVTLVSALQTVAAHKLAQVDQAIDSDVLVFGDQVTARDQVVALLALIGLRGIHAGRLDNAVAAEALTSILIGINKRYKVDGAGIRVTGVTRPAPGG
jgi:NADPH-dependent F420 reductase